MKTMKQSKYIYENGGYVCKILGCSFKCMAESLIKSHEELKHKPRLKLLPELGLLGRLEACQRNGG